MPISSKVTQVPDGWEHYATDGKYFVRTTMRKQPNEEQKRILDDSARWRIARNYLDEAKTALQLAKYGVTYPTKDPDEGEHDAGI